MDKYITKIAKDTETKADTRIPIIVYNYIISFK